MTAMLQRFDFLDSDAIRFDPMKFTPGGKCFKLRAQTISEASFVRDSGKTWLQLTYEPAKPSDEKLGFRCRVWRVSKRYRDKIPRSHWWLRIPGTGEAQDDVFYLQQAIEIFSSARCSNTPVV